MLRLVETNDAVNHRDIIVISSLVGPFIPHNDVLQVGQPFPQKVMVFPTKYSTCTYRIFMYVSDFQSFPFGAPMLIYMYRVCVHTPTGFSIVCFLFPH